MVDVEGRDFDSIARTRVSEFVFLTNPNYYQKTIIYTITVSYVLFYILNQPVNYQNMKD